MHKNKDKTPFKKSWKVPLIIVGIGVSISVIMYSILAFFVASSIAAHPNINADAAIVLGARIYKNGTNNPCLVSRVNMAAKLYKQKKVSTIIASGGNDREDGVNEATEMQKMLVAKGIPMQNVLLENQSTSTYENLQNAKKIMTDHAIKSTIIVTEPFHVERAKLVAKTLGINAQFAASESSPCWQNGTYFSHYFLKEPIAVLSYILTGKITLSAFN